MTINLQIAYRDFDPPLLAEERIRERVEKLERLYPRMIALHIVAEQVQHRHHKGKLYRFRLDAVMPGKEIAVTHGNADKHAHEDFFVAMRDSFNSLERSLKTFTEKQDLDVKVHDVPPHGRVKTIFPDYGFIETPDGLEIYFHANSVADGRFEDLDVGAEVRFSVAEKESDKGPQATFVKLLS